MGAETTFTLPQISGAATVFFTLCVAAGYVLKKSGLLTFGKPVERRDCQRKCQDHDHLIKVVEDIRKTQKSSEKRMDRMDRNLSEVIGYIHGKNGAHIG